MMKTFLGNCIKNKIILEKSFYYVSSPVLSTSNAHFSSKRVNIKNKFKYSNLIASTMKEPEDDSCKTHGLVSANMKPMKNKLSKRNENIQWSTSKPNKTVTKRGRDRADLGYKGEILFGVHPVYLALMEKKRSFYQVFLRKAFESTTEKTSIVNKIRHIAEELQISVKNVDSQILRHLAPGAVHQGVCLDASALPLLNYDIKKINGCLQSKVPIYLILDEILDPMNVGAIIRSAYYFGISNIFVVKANSCKLSPTVSKASSGVLEIVNIYQIENLVDFISKMKNTGWSVLSTVTYCEDKITCDNTIDAAELKIERPTLLILGNEGRGISCSVRKLCDNFITINPSKKLHEGIDSLNVSVAAGVIMHSLMCSRNDTSK